uniref:NADH-ubiquinone oxidoreductase chain 2 n=1 Tax=Solenodon paradoxus woodi TaxID=1906353 RepID=A0A3G1FI82_SOLPA|nr:NADH dehydrogenase subunit 2 [Solenodon paradoxus woodi]AOT98850.1 NADH dehydrogenase subunit 2 [Solenodon paradoxus woodi]AOT98863.1 NADH dehydrogenase subunit 2 [Solenodon paradoxus woodi]AOT98876.1 NADH dehydrogenase subunit 2 [Solenodon paradoxus woodi]AOT98889.1 NADH dehydrogenase subunit 2 [Solenodon paradoxus woodi]
MNPLVMMMLVMTVIMSTSIVMMSSHWLLVWIGFEMNTLAIIPILMKNHTPRSTEAATKYFLTQATASMILMLAIIINLLFSGHWSVMSMQNIMASTAMTIALTMKLGMAPFHFWVPEVTQGIPLTSGMVLLTWQKLAPLSILMQTSNSMNINLLMTMSLTSIMIGGWGGLNQTQLRKIMAYSSIAHMGWMVAILAYNQTLTMLNLIIYIVMTTTMFMLLIMHSTTTTLMLSNTGSKNPITMIMMTILLLSMGGLPPLTGFAPKWMIIQELTKNEMVILPSIMAISALLSLYFYVRLTYSTALTTLPSTNNMKMKWKFEHTKAMMMLPTLFIISSMMLPMTPLMSTLM